MKGAEEPEERIKSPVCVLSAAKAAGRKKAIRKRLPALVDPDSYTRNAVISNGRITELYKVMRDLSR